MPLFFNKSVAWEKRREGLNRLFSLMFQEFTRECFFSPLLISFFGGDISNIHITENQDSLSSPSSQASHTESSLCGVSVAVHKKVSSLEDETIKASRESTCMERRSGSASVLDVNIDMQGELWYQNKQTNEGSNTQWKKRYFTTDSAGVKAQLYMWKDNTKCVLLNSLDLSNYKVEHAAQPALSMLGFGSKTPGSMILIEAGQDGQEVMFRGKSSHEVTCFLSKSHYCNLHLT